MRTAQMRMCPDWPAAFFARNIFDDFFKSVRNLSFQSMKGIDLMKYGQQI